MIRAFLTLVGRELGERRLAPAAAALLGLLPLVAPALPGMAAHPPLLVRQSTLLLVLGLILITWPIGLGSSLASGELVGKRLGFYFTRPISGALLWLAKVTAAWLLLALSAFLAAAPSLLTDGALRSALLDFRSRIPGPLLAYPEMMIYSIGQQPEPWPWPARIATVLIAGLLALLLVHTVSSLLRVRSPWLLADVLALGLLLAGVWWLRHLLLSHQAYGAMALLERGLLFTGTAVLLTAGAWQLGSGRSQTRRSRRCLALALWPGLGVLILASLVYAHWVVSPAFDDLVGFTETSLDPAGRHLVLGGPVAHRAGHQAAFLVDLETGGAELLGGLAVLGDSTLFSADGSRLVWPRCRRLAPADCEIWTRDLRAGTASRPTGIQFGPHVDGQALTESGDLLLTHGWRQVSVYAVASGRLLGALRIDSLVAAHFLSPNRILVVRNDGDDSFLSVWNLDSHQREDLVQLPGSWNSRRQILDTRHGVFLANSVFPRLRQVRDLETGALLIDLEPMIGRSGLLGDARFLADGRLVFVFFRDQEHPRTSEIPFADPTDATLMVLDPERPDSWRRLEVPQVLDLELGPELRGGRLLVRRRDPEPPPPSPILRQLGLEPLEGRSTWIFDAGPPDETSTEPKLELLAGGLVPSRSPAASPEGPRLLFAQDFATLRWFPDRGDFELLMPPLD